MKSIAGTIVFLLLLVTSCTKENFCAEGYIRWGGDPAADGLGWHYVNDLTDSRVYILENLPDDFKRDSLPVRICLKETNRKFYCECSRPFNYYHINSVTRR